MQRTELVAIAAGLALALPTAADAADAPPEKSYRIFGQLTSDLERNLADDGDDPNDADYTKFKQLASVNLEWSHFTVGAQLEYLDWSVPFELRDPLDLDRIRNGFELRKYYLDYQNPKFSGRLGTFYSSFGRGLTLYVQKNDVLGFDEPIHGATARLNLKHVDVSALWGNVAEPVLQTQYGREFEDEVMGGRIVGRLPLGFYLGGSAARAELERTLPVIVGNRRVTHDTVEVWAAEGGANGLWGMLDVAAEVSELSRTEPTPNPDNPTREIEGHGRYVSASLYVGPVSILGEYKDYYNFQYRYNLPPNAGRANESYNHDDVRGPRLLVSADIFKTGSLIHASYASFDRNENLASPGESGGDEQTEWYAGLEQTIGPVYFEASYFNRDFVDRQIEERHTLGDFHYRVGRSGEIILGYDQRVEESSVSRLDITRTFVGFTLSPWGSVTLRYAWRDSEAPSRSEREDFWGVEVQALPTRTLAITVFAGGDPGGLVCAGGQCRQEPPFKGARGNLTWRF